MRRNAFVVLGLLMSSVCLAQEKTMFDSGNSFLHSCDANNPTWIAGNWTPRDKEIQVLMCTLYVTGIRQGIEVTEQVRPGQSHTTTQAEKRLSEANAQAVQKLVGNLKPLMFPDRNACIPEDITSEQMRLVVIKWMKDHPELLTYHAAHLTFAAITSTWPCD